MKMLRHLFCCMLEYFNHITLGTFGSWAVENLMGKHLFWQYIRNSLAAQLNSEEVRLSQAAVCTVSKYCYIFAFVDGSLTWTLNREMQLSDWVIALQGFYAGYVGTCVPTFLNTLSVPSSRAKQCKRTLRNGLEEWRPHLHRGKSLKLRTLHDCYVSLNILLVFTGMKFVKSFSKAQECRVSMPV
jgi:hypothetical protein